MKIMNRTIKPWQLCVCVVISLLVVILSSHPTTDIESNTEIDSEATSSKQYKQQNNYYEEIPNAVPLYEVESSEPQYISAVSTSGKHVYKSSSYIADEAIEPEEVEEKVVDVCGYSIPESNLYGDWTYEDYILIATTIYCESGPNFEEAVSCGWVMRNRLEDTEVWKYDSWIEVISAENQFSVYSTSGESKFQKIKSTIADADDSLSMNAKNAALLVMNGYMEIPDNIQFFCSDDYYDYVKKPNGNWSGHPLYQIIGGTAFFYYN